MINNNIYSINNEKASNSLFTEAAGPRYCRKSKVPRVNIEVSGETSTKISTSLNLNPSYDRPSIWRSILKSMKLQDS